MLTLRLNANSMKKNAHSRRRFLNRIIAILMVPFLYFWYRAVKMSSVLETGKEKIVPATDIPEGITFYDEVIICKKEGEIVVFSARCSHLGCTINRFENDRLICPCHGSEYSVEGEVSKGPSSRPLEKLNYRIDAVSNNLVIDIS
jgi:Rieske Fe-S protein